jgi:hypothetical protein
MHFVLQPLFHIGKLIPHSCVDPLILAGYLVISVWLKVNDAPLWCEVTRLKSLFHRVVHANGFDGIVTASTPVEKIIDFHTPKSPASLT